MYTKPHVSTFEGGLNTDVSHHKMAPNMYRDGRNIRILTDTGLSSGAVTNEYGNRILFKIPDVVWPTFYREVTGAGAAEVVYVINGNAIAGVPDDSAQKAYDYLIIEIENNYPGELGVLYDIHLNRKEITVHSITDIGTPQVTPPGGGTVVDMLIRGAQQDNLKIINMGVAGDYVVVFTTNENNTMEEPDGTYGQIWKFKYDKINEIIEPDYIDGSGFLTLSKSLVVNRILDFSLANKIHFETYVKNDEVVKIYMYDGYNILKHINILDPQTHGLADSAMDIVSDVSFSYPVPVEIIESGSLLSGQYRYAYQMYNLDGNQTTYSPTSIAIDIHPTGYYADTDLGVVGGNPDDNSGKSVRLTINDLDLSYERVRIVSIYYPSNTGIPTITVIKDTAIPEAGSIQIVDDGTTAFGAVTIQEFRTLGTELFIPATAEVKDNMLIVGNIIDKRFEIGDDVWDARAYRFESGGTATDLKTISGTVLNVSSASADPVNWDVPITHDCIQDYEFQETAAYQPGTSNLGGEGPNVKYTFIVGPEILLMKDITRGQTDVQWANAHPPTVIEDTNLSKQVRFSSERDGSTVYDFNGTQYTNFSYKNYASPIISGLFKGYTKNEMYRFGIEFFDRKGRRCFVKWIADIRFPDLGATIPEDWEGTTVDYKLVNSSAASSSIPTEDDAASVTSFPQVTVRPLGIRFEVNNLPTDEDGVPYDYRIVRVRREEDDKRMVLQGPLMNLETYVEGASPNITYYRPLVLNTCCREVRGLYEDFDESGIGGTAYYRYGNYASLVGKSGVEPTSGGNQWQDLSSTSHIKDIPQSVQHMFISPEIYFLKNYIIPSGLKFRPIGFQHIQERDTIDSYKHTDGAGGYFYDTTIPGQDGAGKYAFVTGAPQFYWGEEHMNGNKDSNEYEVKDAQIVPTPPPDFHVGSAVYTLSDGALVTFTYRNVSWTNLQGEEQKEAARAGTRLIVLFDRVFDRANPLIPLTSAYELMTSTLMGRMERDLANQYGGNSYYDRTQSTYIPAGPIIKGDTNSTPTFEGDTYINVFDYLNINFASRLDGDQGLGLMETQWFIMESTINIDMRSAISYNDTVDLSPIPNDGNTLNDYRGNYLIQETGSGSFGVPNVNDGQYIQNYSLTDYNTSYIAENTAPLSIPIPLNYDSNIFFYARIHRSQDKVYDDVYDRWLVFLPDNYKDVNTEYGKISNLIEYANKLYFYQERAVGIIGINEMALEQTDQAGATLLLGRADVMDQYVYIDNNHGVVIPNSVYAIPQGVIGFDSENLKIFMVGAQGVSEISTSLGIQSLVRKSSQYGALDFHGVYDSFHNRSYNILHGVGDDTGGGVPTTVSLPVGKAAIKENVSFNAAIGVFESLYDFTPDSMLVYKGELITANPDNNEGWIHSPNVNRVTFYGTAYDWHVTPIINKDAYINHLITNFEINMDTHGSTDPPKILTADTFPSTGLYDTTTFKRRLNTWRCEAPREQTGIYRERLRGHSFYAELRLDHVTRTVIHSVLSYAIPNPQ